MTEFFLQNMDYVYFVYGLLFILMSALCRGLTLEGSDRLPWRWLGGFGLFQGLAKWLDMLAISQGESAALRTVQVAFLLVSGIALVEFGRRGLRRNGHPAVGAWLVPGLSLLALLAALDGGLPGLNVGARYAFGIPGSLLAMLALVSIIRLETDAVKRRGLVLSAACLFFFGVAQVVAPPARFEPASWLNHATFFNALGFPVQLVRAFGIAGVMTGFWIYRQRLLPDTPPRFRGLPWLTPLVFASLIVLGWYGAEQRAASMQAELRERLMEQASALAKAINPDDAKALSFTADDPAAPPYQRMRSQLISISHVISCRSIYTIALRKGRLVFGPSTYDESALTTSRPGAVYRDARPEDLALFNKIGLFTIGTEKNRFGTFIAAHAPICDLRTGRVLMHIGIEVDPQKWQVRIARARLMPIAGVMILIVTLLVGIDLIRRRDRLLAVHRGSLRHVESFLVGLCGVVITLVFALLLHESEVRRRQSTFDRFAESRAGQVRDEVIAIRTDLASLSRFFESSQDVTPDEFQSFAGTMVQADAVEAFGWVPIVPANRLDAFLREFQRNGMDGFSLWEASGPDSRAVASGRPCYYPLLYVEPLAEHAAALGFDLGSDPVQRPALERALRDRLWAATPASPLVHQPRHQPAVLAFYPVNVMLPAGAGKPAKPGEVRGFVVGVVRFQNLLMRASSRAGLGECFMDLDLVDLTDTDRPRLVATRPETPVYDHQAILDETDQFPLVNLQPIFAFGRTYAVISHPAASFLSAYPLHVSGQAAAGGLLLTAILTLFVAFLRTRQVSMEQEVRQRTAALRESQENLAVTLNSIGDGVIATDTHSRIRQMNPAAERLTGWTLAEALDRPLPEVFRVINSRSRQPVTNPVDRVIASGAIVDLANPTALIARNGRERQIADSAAPIRDASGVTTGVVLVFSDVTEEHAARLLLEESEQQYRLLAEHASDVICRLSPEGLFLYISPSCRTMLGYEPAEMMEHPATDFVHPADLAQFRTSIKNVLSTDTSNSVTYRYRHKDCSYRWVESTGKRVLDPIREIPREIIVVSRDISERKGSDEVRLEMERRLFHSQKLESLGVLAGGIAHDFNNLLTAVLGNLELAQGDLPDTAPARAGVDQAIHAAKRAADLTRQMLAYSGKGLFAITELSLNELVEENAHMLKAAISKTVSLNLFLAPQLPRIQADPGQIQQVIMNLITNASEAIGERVGIVNLSTGSRDFTADELAESRLPEKTPPGRFVWLKVADTGCGMDAEVVRRIFEPFFTTKFTGRGLGMSAVLGIVRGHHGAIFLDSIPKSGTTVQVLFPISLRPAPAADAAPERAPAAPPAPVSPAAPGAPASEGGGIILVVDDEQIVCDICSNTLRRNGYTTLTALDGEQGVQVFREHADEILAVILDLTMPRMDGATAFREMKRIRPGAKIILSSGHAEQEALRHFDGQVVAGFLQKPYPLKVLLSELARVIGDRPA